MDLDPHKKQSSFSQAVENQPSDSVISWALPWLKTCFNKETHCFLYLSPVEWGVQAGVHVVAIPPRTDHCDF